MVYGRAVVLGASESPTGVGLGVVVGTWGVGVACG